MKQTHKAEVPEDLLYPDPENESPDRMTTVEFEYVPGTGPTGLSGPPENYDPGSDDEFYVVCPPELSADAEERVVEWLAEHWERPDDGPDPDWERDMRRDEALP